MWRLLQLCCCCWWIFSLVLPASVPLWADCHPALTGSQAKSQALIHGFRKAEVGGARLRRAATEETYWAYSGIYGPDEGWASAYPECREKNQSPINIVDQDTKVSTEYQELTLEGFDTESSNKTSMKNTGKTVAIMLKDDYFVRGAGLPGRFKAEKVEFHWGPSNGSEGSEHSINGRRYPVEMQIYMYNSDDFDSLSGALRERRIIAAMAVFFQVGGKDNPAVDPIIHGLKGVVHHEKETFLEPFVLKDLLPSSLGSYYRYTGSLTTPPCSKVVEWIIFNRPIYVSYKQLEAFYSIFTTEQQDHVKSVEYLRSNFRPIQSLDNRHVFKSAVKDAWLPDLTDSATGPYGAEASKVCSSAPINMKVQHVNGSALVVRWSHPEVTYHPPILHFLVSYSWTAHDDSYEETHLTDAKHKLEAIISPVSPDVLYLFRVQAVCTNDMRSDFSQSMLFRANTTRIFEGTRIVKTGMPTVSPASSADMAPISSGSSTWTSSGIPFSFVSMATGIGPSSSGSQATVASVVTSTLLAGLGFSGGVISSFPSVVWPSRVLVHNPTSTHQTTELTKDTTISASDVTTAVAKDNGEAGDEDSKGQGEDEDSEEEDKKEEEEEEKDKKKGRKGSGQVGNARIKDSSRVSEQPNETEDSTAKKKKQTEPDPTKKTNIIQLDVYTHNPFDSNSSTTSGAAFPVLKDHAGALKPSTGRDKKPFSIHIECPSALNNVTDHARPRSRTGLGQVECLVLLVVVSALTFFCLVLLLVVLIYWRRCFQRVHLHVEDHSSPRVVPNEMMPVVSIPDDMEAISVKQLIKHIPELYSNNQQGFSEDFEGVKGNPKAWAQHEQTVLQYYYTKWPDMDILPVLTFVCRSPAAQTPVMGLVFAHFSAGVGQTGTYIVTDSMLQQIRNKSTVIVLGFLKQIRTQHNYLVLTEERYIFTHNALMVADLMKTTEMAARQIHIYLTHITTPGHSGITHLDKQFKLVTQCNVRFMESFTTQDCNKGKNQNSSVVLLEQVRVNLVPLPGIKGTDYINVSYIMGYYRSNKSIITQQPLPNTTKDFWRLIWDHNSQIIVILPTVHGQDLYVLKACHFQCPKWPNPDASLSTTFELTDIIKEEMSTFDRPTIIYDKFTTLSQQPNNEDTVNVYQVAEMIMRSRVFTDIDQYRYLYKAMFSFVSTKENSSGLLASDTNRTIVSMSNQKDSKESLM